MSDSQRIKCCWCLLITVQWCTSISSPSIHHAPKFSSKQINTRCLFFVFSYLRRPPTFSIGQQKYPIQNEKETIESLATQIQNGNAAAAAATMGRMSRFQSNCYSRNMLDLVPVWMPICFARPHELVIAGPQSKLLKRLGQLWKRLNVQAKIHLQFME